jgi:flavin-dependent dehydrogenase
MCKVTSVGIVVSVDDYRRDASEYGSIEEYFRATCASARYLGRLLEDARLVKGGIRVLRDFSYISATVAGPGFLVIGDAAGFVDPIFSIGVVMALYSGHLAAWTVDRALQHRAVTDMTQRFFAQQMRGRYELARTMALPGLSADASAPAETYFDFFSKSEKELMWSAASMTTRSGNLVRASGGEGGPVTLKRAELRDLQFG